ncbi:MAG: hypothetical protein Q9211_004818, partial [Gyalolechia sp. 1 TL-2023]
LGHRPTAIASSTPIAVPMASRLFSNGGNASNVKFFEIRFVDPSTSLNMTINPIPSNHTRKDEVFVRHTWEFVYPGSKRGHTLATGNYEWPFEHILPGHTPESVEGLQDSWIIYRMKATVDRGVLAQNVLARKHVRIIRTLDTAALELSHEMVQSFHCKLYSILIAEHPQAVENTWVDKIDYTLSTPTKGVIFGTAVQVHFRIVSLLKGLKIGEVSTKINETQDIIFDLRRQAKKIRSTRTVAEDRFHFPQDQETVLIDGQDAWVFTRQITLPKSLRECLQTVDALGIRAKHNLTFNVKLLNPDEHVSEVLLSKFICRVNADFDLLIDEENNVILHNLGGVDPDTFAVGAPPLYGQHQLDILYNDLSPTGYTTPAGCLSALSTPFSQSRRGSADNLASMNMMTTSVLPTALQSRLSSLNNPPGVSTNHGLETPSTSEGISLVGAQVLPLNDSSLVTPNADESRQDAAIVTPRRMSDHDSEHSGAQHVEFGPEEMSKVPSYSTALRSHPQTPINAVPPTYQSATSQQI